MTLWLAPVDNSCETLDIKKPILQLLLLLVTLGAIVAGVYFGFQYVQMRDPYIQLVMAEKGNFAQGAAIFQINCAGCHGIQGDGLVGPSLHAISDRKSSLTLIRQVISGKTPPMPQFQPNPQEMADLLSYLDEL
ncbi:MAG: c-type cytochrome [Prochlorotrichaceae cyanobacterium]